MKFKIQWEVIAHVKPEGSLFGANVLLANGESEVVSWDWPSARKLAEDTAVGDTRQMAGERDPGWLEIPMSLRVLSVQELPEAPPEAPKEAQAVVVPGNIPWVPDGMRQGTWF